MPAGVQARIVDRLREIERARSEDLLRLAGVGRFGVTHARPLPSRAQAPTPPVAGGPEMVLCSFESEATLDALVNDAQAYPPFPSDAPELDAFAAQILTAFETTDVVDVPGLIRLHVETSEARRGATIDGHPTLVPRRRRIGFTLASELRRSLDA